MSKFLLEIITPERSFFCEEVESIIVPAEDGLMSIHKNHEPVVVALAPGVTRIHTAQGWRECVITLGFLEVRPDSSILFATTAEWPEEIDLEEAQRELSLAEEQMLRRQSDEEYKLSKVQMARAMARLRVGRGSINI